MEAAMQKIFEELAQNRITRLEALECIKQIKQQHSAANGDDSPADETDAFACSFIYGEPFLKDHQVFGEQVLLGVTHCSLALEAACSLYPDRPLRSLHKVLFSNPVILYSEETVDVMVKARESEGRFFFRNIYEKSGGDLAETASGEYLFGRVPEPPAVDLSSVLAAPDRVISGSEMYAKLASTPILHGSSLKTVRNVFIRGKELIGELSLTDEAEQSGYPYQLHPALLDGAVVTVLAGLPEEFAGSFVPFMVRDIHFHKALPKDCFCRATIDKITPELLVADIEMCDAHGSVLASLTGFTCKSVKSKDAFDRKNSREVVGPSGDQPAPSRPTPARSETSAAEGMDLTKAIEQYLVDKVRPLLSDGKKEVNKQENFMDSGLDSTKLVSMSQEIAKELGLELYPTLFFEYQNVHELARYFAQEHGAELADSGFLQAKGAEPPPARVEKKAPKASPARVVASEQKPKAASNSENGDIAVIGMAGMFAGSPDLTSFWENIRGKKELMKEIPLDHFDYRPWFDPTLMMPDMTYSKWGSFIDDVDKFDASFFNISPREAEMMDPQLRLFMQVVAATIEDAGYGGRIKGSKTGVYAGVCFHDYEDARGLMTRQIDPHSGTGNAATMISNRPSFTFDLRGPSLTVDTACSSSLVALHLACKALREDECEMALVGGTNLLLNSGHYRYFCSIGALSPTGRCHTFGEEADGYTPGEGIAAVLLKPLAKAVADGDLIHALIKGTAINHGGYTPSVTAPSMKQEARVILDAWKDAGIDPATIGYIEAHGTGTKLGDPVEINGLKEAFRGVSVTEPFCAVGSVKAHIGHTEGAAGVAGLVKVILSLKHKEIPAMPNFGALNPYLKLEGSPLFINREVAPWRKIDGAPRRAGVSSFGFGGAYAHAVVEEYEESRTAPASQGAQLVVLSAKNEERLQAYVAKFAATLAGKDQAAFDLADVAYTLQTGRESMDERLATVVSGIGELRQVLARYLDGESDIPNLYRGNVGSDKSGNEPPVEEEHLCGLLEHREFASLAQFWISGCVIDWQLLYASGKPRRISLPTYEFAKESYWMGEPDYSGGNDKLHPLLDSNQSTLEEQCFRKVMNGKEFYLADHIVKGEKILPGVAYLEMARAAGELAGAKKVISVRNSVWARPIVMGDDCQGVNIALYPSGDAAEYEVTTTDEQGERIIHAQGKVVYQQAKSVDAQEERVDLEAIRKRCPVTKSKEQCYAQFKELGIQYGPGFQSIKELSIGDEEALSLLEIPEVEKGFFEQYGLHPALLDGALQTVMGFTNDTELRLPFALGELEMLRPLVERCYAHVTKSAAGPKGSAIEKFGIALMDEDGQVLVKMKEFAVRSFQPVLVSVADAEPAETASELPEETSSVDGKQLQEKTETYLKNILSKTLKLPAARIDAKEPLEKYGIDSVIILNLSRELENNFGELSKTLFFEYQDIRSLATYFIENHREALQKKVGETRKAGKEVSAPKKSESTGTLSSARSRFLNGATGFREERGAVDIAVIGVSGRYPMAKNLDEFWENLKSGRDCITEIPAERWDWREDFDPDKEKSGKSYSKWGGFISDVDKFDPLFFNISPREAEIMDPQERLFLQTVWQTVEDAGYTKSRLSGGKVGVFAGVMFGHYQMYGAEESLKGNVMALSSSYASIANRVSYYFNFHGPSIALDTMCSSSLTAIHLACESIRSGESELAIAGGVNASLHPNKYIFLSQGGFCSSEGKCRAFGSGGDGYVPGEGVGAVLLKPLSQAVADGDRIYAVIKGSSINSGGKTNGYTVPNPNAQGDLITETLKKAKIDARTISYVEAHGTGTSLGDPIEIAGLMKAYRGYTEDRNFCSIGSAKSNIGHLESAAGIAGVTKVLLQMKHKQLAPSIHTEELNPNINFENSAFNVQRELAEWQEPVIEENGEARRYPRRASVSSFGAGGANAHIVLEEYPTPETQADGEDQQPQIVVLSAKNNARLREYAGEMAEFLEKNSVRLGDAAYTMQTGREAMDERLALTASSVEELRLKLAEYQQGKTDIDGLHQGNVKGNKAALLVQGRAGEEFVRISIEDGELPQLARLWASGGEIDWNLLHKEEKPNRISLPCYPFEPKRCWFTQTPSGYIAGNGEVAAAKLHPLLGSNTSNLREQRFTTLLTGREFYLADHRVGGEKVLPGVAYLEMARAAGELASEQKVRAVRNTLWAMPVTVKDSPRELCVSLYPEKEVVEYEVSSDGANGKRVVHAQGKLHFGEKSAASETIDLKSIRERCQAGRSGKECYQLFDKRGLNYGPAFRPITELYSGNGEALSLLELPETVKAGFQEFNLHPSLMDGALQTVLGLLEGADADSRELHLPFALGEVEIVRPMKERCYAYATIAGDSGSSRVKKYTILLLDEQGQLLVRLKDFTIRAVQRPEVSLEKPRLNDALYYQAKWEESARVSRAEQVSGNMLIFDNDRDFRDSLQARLAAGTETVLVQPGEGYRDLGNGTYQVRPGERDDYLSLLNELKARGMEPATVINHWSQNEVAGADQLRGELAKGVYSLVNLIQVLMEQKPKGKIRILQVSSNKDGEAAPQQQAMGAFLKTVRMENPSLLCKSVAFDASTTLSQQAELVLAELQPAADAEAEVIYQGGRRFLKRVQELAAEENAGGMPLKERGVYLITGGAGGLGLIFAKYLAGKVKARLVLTGRSELSAQTRDKLQELESLGSEVLYLRADVSKKDEVTKLVAEVKSRFGELNGVIHSAGVVRDAFVLKKTKEEMDEVLAPKIYATLHLDEATKGEPIDFFVLFSSAAAVMGNIGQCDYAYGNSFMDSFVRQREKNKHPGKSISINWPLWREGGMQVDQQTELWMEKRFGLVPLETAQGLRAFEQALFADRSQLIVFSGKKEKINDQLGVVSAAATAVPTAAPQSAPTGASGDALREQVERDLVALFVELLKVTESDIDLDEELDNYGVDSIMMMTILNRIESLYGNSVAPNAIAEHNTVKRLAAYLVAEGVAKPELNAQPAAVQAKSAPEPAAAALPAMPSLNDKRRRFTTETATVAVAGSKIAVIAMACRFPQSPSVEAFWDNLKSGKNMVTEIPAERWNVAEHFSADRKAPNMSYSKWGGFIDAPYSFDPGRFGITEADAVAMDPQHRILLELTEELFGRAGYGKEEVSNSKTAVFIGGGESAYLKNDGLKIPDEYMKRIIVNTIPNMMAARISDFYNLRSTSQTIDTACSSSLVAIHNACRSIVSGESTMAIAGGIELLLNPFLHVGFSKAEVLSPDGVSYVFDEKAQGFVLGEGGGLVLLKGYDAAVRDGDLILGVIRGSAVNNDGHTMGLTVPSMEAQQDVIREALDRSGVPADSIGYLEAHGTGTLLGDPIEIKAATNVYREQTQTTRYCAVGSVKSNMGHLMRGAGVASFIKVLLALGNKEIPPTLHCTKPHPRFKFEESPFYPVTAGEPWHPRMGARRAAISSFGFGGTNCHMILEEFTGESGYEPARQPLSAPSFSRKRYRLGQEIVADPGTGSARAAMPVQDAGISLQRNFAYDEPYMRDHTVFGEQVLLGVTHCSLAVEAVCAGDHPEAVTGVHKLLFSEPVMVSQGERAEVTVSVAKRDGRVFFTNRYRKSPQSGYAETATGEYLFDSPPLPVPVELSRFLRNADRVIPGAEIYRKLAAKSIEHGPSLQTVQNAYAFGDEMLGELSITEEMVNRYPYLLHPALLDGAIVSTLSGVADALSGPFVPFMIKALHIYQPLPKNCFCRSRIVTMNAEIIVADIDFCDGDGKVLAAISGFSCKAVRAKGTFGEADHREREAVSPRLPTPLPLQPVAGPNLESLEERIETYLTEKVAALIGGDARGVSKERNFMDIGVDSTSLVEMSRVIEREFSLELYPTLFFEYPNIKELSRYFAEEHGESFAASLSVTAAGETTEEIVVPYAPSVALHAQASTMPEPKGAPEQVEQGRRAPNGGDSLDDDIAVIGMGGMFAGSPDLGSFWENIRGKKELMSEIPLDHFDSRPWFDPTPGLVDKMYCKWGSFIDGVDKFDAGFFNISPREAEMMDPQLRLFMQVVSATAEDAGYGSRLRGSKTGMYVGACFHDYENEMLLRLPHIDPYSGTGTSATMFSNRPSFYFDLRGPSLTVDTACSSSLVALHLACKALQQGECDMAFVGGTNLLVGSGHYRYFCSINALSPSGRCHTFGAEADGYTPGEGVAAVLLKPLRKAIADGDQIHAVVKGSAINHGGYTPSVTAPSMKQEARVISDAWKDAGIDPATIGYIEAHGTGTKLGDPVEINALKEAFKVVSAKEPFCAVGSAKAHIGHAEGAAGIAGILKVILSMKNKEIPAMPKFTKLNPYIKLEGTPLFVNREVTPWHGINGAPLRAGVSSFGFGGAYAHVVIEAYEQPAKRVLSAGRQLVVLSAKDEERLKEYAGNVAAFLKDKDDQLSLADIAYTLQSGREAMEERLGLVVSDLSELREQLLSYCGQDVTPVFAYKGSSEQRREKGRIEGEESVGTLIQEKVLPEIARLWVSGVEIDWNSLRGEERHHYLSLPTYPFAKERYWLAEAEEKSASLAGGAAQLHPLVHVNSSTLREQQFSTRFTGHEFYLTDHVVGGHKILPGVAYLEMARAAGEIGGEKPVRALKNMVWARPVVVAEGGQEVQISLRPDGALVEYEVSSYQGDEKLIHAQGKLSYDLDPSRPTADAALDIRAIKARCSVTKSGAECYQMFEKRGIALGAKFRSIQELYGSETEAISLLELPAAVKGSLQELILHPDLLDGAFQTAIGLTATQGKDEGISYLPFAVGELEVFAPLPERCYAYVTMLPKDSTTHGILRFDSQLLDESGRVLVKFNNVSCRALQSAKPQPELMSFRSDWEESAADGEGLDLELLGDVLIFDRNDELKNTVEKLLVDKGAPGARVILVRPGKEYLDAGNLNYQVRRDQKEDYLRLLAELKNQGIAPEKILHLWSQAESAESEGEDSPVYPLLWLAQALMEQKIGKVGLTYAFGGNDGQPQPLHAAIGGFARTMRRENPNFLFKTLQSSSFELLDAVVRELQRGEDGEVEVRYQSGRRLVKRLNEVAVRPGADVQSLLREKGVYLITGGAGELGLVFADYLARKVKGRLVLAGRSPLTEDQQKKIRELESLGAQVLYVQADTSDGKEMERLVAGAKSRFGEINGVIHAAGVIRDSFVLMKSREDAEAVLAPKVAGTVNLDAATANERLDFFVLFSSIAGVLGNPGQCDYAYANSFMDSFAELRAGKERFGKSLSINWPLWKDGGMRVDEQAVRLIEENTGLIPLGSENGILAFQEGLNGIGTQVVVAQGDPAKIRKTLATAPLAHLQKRGTGQKLDEAEKSRLQESAENYFKEMLSATLRIPVAKFKSNVSFDKYGIDSVMVMQLSKEFESRFGEVSKTLFFEYPTIRELAGYFAENHPEKFTAGPAEVVAETTEQKPLRDLVKEVPPPSDRPRFMSLPAQTAKRAEEREEIAIIGVSGRYPKAKNVEEYWQNLRNGIDCVTEIPPERWDIDQHYHQDKKRLGKSYSKWGGFLDNIDKFDPEFFNIPVFDTMLMDPQERLFLETAWQTVEDAGYTRGALERENVGVYVGVMYGEYHFFGVEESLKGNPVAASSSPASIANRVSYHLGFHGPSMAVDTMCSSSITAIHLACESIRRGECGLAVAGGVNLSLHPNKYSLLSQMGVISSDHKSRSFGEGGDGYVPAEGVGAVLLKTLSAARRDGDHVYAVIKGSSLNSAGVRSGYMMPNPNAQANVVLEAIKRSQIDARTISYVEAFAVGNLRADPLEIAGLTKAFKEYTADRQYCAIGSGKSSTGHMESASGISSLTKVLMQMQHKELAPSLHAAILNPAIDFEKGPFFVQRELAEWKQPLVKVNGEEKLCPRRAAVTAFGAGGAYGCLVIEEPDEPVVRAVQQEEPQLVVLSARNDERLREQAERLLSFLESRTVEPRLTDIAFTLQVGREAMAERLALVVSSVGELRDKLSLYCKGVEELDNCYGGNIESDREQSLFMLEGSAGEEFLCALLRNRDLSRVAQLWVAGAEMELGLLHQPGSARRISLPTYSFAAERYWVPRSGEEDAEAESEAVYEGALSMGEGDGILVQGATIQPDAAVATNCRIHDKAVLPGVWQLDLAAAAALRISEGAGISLSNVSWLRPLSIRGSKVDLQMVVKREGDHARFEIRSTAATAATFYGKGEIAFLKSSKKRAQRLSIDSIKAVCPILIEKERLYEQAKGLGITYGPYFQPVSVMWGGREEGLSLLSLPAECEAELKGHMLHPALLMGVLQTIAALPIIRRLGKAAVMTPSRVDKVEMLAPLTGTCYAYVKLAGWNRFHVMILDESGLVCVRLRNLSLRKINPPREPLQLAKSLTGNSSKKRGSRSSRWLGIGNLKQYLFGVIGRS